MATGSVFLLGIDIGTTHFKAGLFDAQGHPVRITSHEMRSERAPRGVIFYDPQVLWVTAQNAIREAVEGIPAGDIAAIGISGMAETGMLVDRSSGDPRTVLFPWFDNTAASQVEILQKAGDPQERFCTAGIRPNFKCSLAKILWLRDRDPSLLDGSLWLSVPDALAFWLTGAPATDFSLAGRTYAFNLDRQDWDIHWLRDLGLDPGMFPPAQQTGTLLGKILPEAAQVTGLAAGMPVCIAGHDHVCAAFAMGVVRAGQVFDSMGTAEALVGAFPSRPLGEADYRSGLVYGLHVVPGMNYWMGGLSASGGSVEWLRGMLADPALSYSDLESLLDSASADPTGILYFPYLAGSGSPHTDIHLRAALVGMNASHRRSDLAKAVLEGTAYEIEFIYRTAEAAVGVPLNRVRVAGGGTRNPHWMQIKADVSGRPLQVLAIQEATLLGAALLAGVCSGVYSDALSAATRKAPELESPTVTFQPDPHRHLAYARLYEHGFLALQAPLRQTARRLATEGAKHGI